MNTKHSFWNRLFAALLLAVMLVTQTTTAFAADEGTEPTEPGTTQAQPAATGTESAGEGTDTTGEENPSEGLQTALQMVSTVEELLQAIEQAEAGATIGIGCEIVCPAGLVIGDNEKTIVLKRTAPEGRVCFYSVDGTGNSAIQNMVLDGNFVDATTAFIQSSMETTFLNCTFSNCMAGPVEVKNGHQYFENCTFENNTAQYGPPYPF